jgi:DNA (cytosine-5)-methyltransferase 1
MSNLLPSDLEMREIVFVPIREDLGGFSGSRPSDQAPSGLDASRVDPGRGAPLKVLSLFSGIGAFDLGLERTGGFKTVAFCEIDQRARRVLAKHWPEIPCYDDVCTLSAERLARDGIDVDAIVGGFPCQDISSQGERAGLEGERSGLWFEMARLIGELRPRFVIVENVAELLANGFGAVLGSLASLGYDAEWDCIPAGAVGAPHLRDRAWIVAHPSEEPGLHESDAWESAKRLLNEPTYWQANPWNEASAAICRMDDGPAERVDRTEECGNAVVPQIPEIIGRAILASCESRHSPNGRDAQRLGAKPEWRGAAEERHSPDLPVEET